MFAVMVAASAPQFPTWVMYFLPLLALPLMLAGLPMPVRAQRRRIFGALALALMLAIGGATYAASGDDFILARPKECDMYGPYDWQWWFYGCATFSM